MKIEKSTASIVMNSRSEWNSNHIPRVMIGVGDNVDMADYSGKLQKKREMNKRAWKKKKTGGEELKEGKRKRDRRDENRD